MQARDANGRFIKGNTTDKGQDMPAATEETTRNYIVPVSAFFLWPIHLGAWLVATVVRAVALVLLVVALVVVYGWWQGTPDSCSVAPAPVAYAAPIKA